LRVFGFEFFSFGNHLAFFWVSILEVLVLLLKNQPKCRSGKVILVQVHQLEHQHQTIFYKLFEDPTGVVKHSFNRFHMVCPRSLTSRFPTKMFMFQVFFILAFWVTSSDFINIVLAIDIRDCIPIYTTPKDVCEPKITDCWNQYRIKLKWTGPGCRSPSGKALGDGGCQCDQVSSDKYTWISFHTNSIFRQSCMIFYSTVLVSKYL
jgi:hypothetical protein